MLLLLCLLASLNAKLTDVYKENGKENDSYLSSILFLEH